MPPWTSSKNCIEPPTQSVKPGTLAHRKERYQAIPTLAIPVCRHLFRTRIRNYNLGRRSRQQATGVLGHGGSSSTGAGFDGERFYRGGAY